MSRSAVRVGDDLGPRVPPLVAWLVAQTGEPHAPAFYVAAATAVSLVALAYAPRRKMMS